MGWGWRPTESPTYPGHCLGTPPAGEERGAGTQCSGGRGGGGVDPPPGQLNYDLGAKGAELFASKIVPETHKPVAPKAVEEKKIQTTWKCLPPQGGGYVSLGRGGGVRPWPAPHEKTFPQVTNEWT